MLAGCGDRARPRRGDEVARQFEVNGALVAQRGVEHAIDFGKRGVGIFERGTGHGDVLEDAPQGIEVAHLVMEERILVALLHARRAADDDHGRFFREGAGDGIHDFESAHAISDAHGAESGHARIGVRGKPRALFIACGDDGAEVAFEKLVVEAKDVIAGDAEDVAHP